MAATKIILLPTDDADQDSGGLRETQYWQVHSDDDTDTPAWALTAAIVDVAAIPAYLSTHPTLPFIAVTAKHAARADRSRRIFLVRVDYSVPPPGWEIEPVPAEEGDEVRWNKKVSMTGIESVEGVNRDIDGNPIKNSYGDVYPATLDQVYYDSQVTVTYNSNLPDITTLESLRGVVNSADVTIAINGFNRTYPAGTLKVGNAGAETEVGPDGATQWLVTIPLLYRYQLGDDDTEIGWTRRIVDKGFRYKTDAGKTVTSDVEVFLDGSGKKLADADPAHLIDADLEATADLTTTILAGV